MKPGCPSGRPFPVLVKWLDCAGRLSLQVHALAEVAAEFEGESKTECRYISESAQDSGLIVGLRDGVTKEQFAEAIESEGLELLLHRFPVAAGESIPRESGRLHTIDAGNLILEIEQNFDTTYRVCDWARVGLGGKPRDLHVAESLASIDFDEVDPQPTAAFPEPGKGVLAEREEFRIRKANLAPGRRFEHPAQRQLLIVSVGRGQVVNEDTNPALRYGANLLAPYSVAGRLGASEGASLLVTDRLFVPGR